MKGSIDQWNIKLTEAADLLNQPLVTFFRDVTKNVAFLASGEPIILKLWIRTRVRKGAKFSRPNYVDGLVSWVFLNQDNISDFLGINGYDISYKSKLIPTSATLSSFENGKDIWEPVTLVTNNKFSMHEIYLDLLTFKWFQYKDSQELKSDSKSTELDKNTKDKSSQNTNKNELSIKTPNRKVPNRKTPNRNKNLFDARGKHWQESRKTIIQAGHEILSNPKKFGEIKRKSNGNIVVQRLAQLIEDHRHSWPLLKDGARGTSLKNIIETLRDARKQDQI